MKKRSVLCLAICIMIANCLRAQVTPADYIGLDETAMTELELKSINVSDCGVHTEQSYSVLSAVYPTTKVLHPHIPNSFPVDTQKDVGEISMSSTISPIGGLSVNIPIDIPQDPRGFTPSIALAYNSQSSMGIAGTGWNIAGLSSISATSLNKYYDNTVRGVVLLPNTLNAFVLDGMRLIKTSTVGDQINYETEFGNIRATAKVISSTISFFKVYFPDGRIATYGNEVQLKGVGLLYPLTKVTDQVGNVINFIYDEIDNHFRIKEITYGKEQQFSVKFFYTENIMYPLIKWNGMVQFRYNYLLNNISTYVNGENQKNYTLSYTIGIDCLHFLNSVNCSAAGKSLNPVRFYYGESDNLLSFDKSADAQLTNWFSYTKPDQIRTLRGKFEYGSENDGLIYLPNKINYLQVNCAPGHLVLEGKPYQAPVSLIENRYDGNEDIFIAPDLNSQYIMPKTIKTGVGFRDIFCADVDRSSSGEEIVKVNNIYDKGLLDSNYDRLIFSVYAPSLYYGLILKYTRTFDFNTLLNYNGIKSIAPKYYFTGDFTGNGKTEILAISCYNVFGKGTPSTCYLFDLESNQILYQGNDFNYYVQFPAEGTTIVSTEDAYKNSNKLYIVDCDGDGKNDICLINDNGTYIYSFDGTSFKLIAAGLLKNSMLTNRTLLVGEFNGDNKTDLLLSPVKGSSDINWKIYSMTGGSLVEAATLGIATNKTTSKYILQDMDGDGQMDLVETFGSTNISLFVYFISDYRYLKAGYYPLDANNILVPTEVSNRNYYNKLITLNSAGEIKKYAYQHNKVKSAQLTGFIDSYGIVNKIGYQQLNEVSDFFSDYIYRVGYEATFPYQDYNGGNLVVNKTETWHNNLMIAGNTYTYEEAILHRQGLGFIGFKKVETYNTLTGDYSYKVYDPFNFSVLKKDEDKTATVDYTYNISVASNKKAKVLLANQTILDKLNNNTISSTFGHDAYGSLIREVNDYGSGITTTKSRQLTNSLIPYILGVPTEISETNTRNGSSVATKTVFTYNEVYLPLTATSYYNNNRTLQESYLYDTSYNLTEKKYQKYSGDWLSSSFTYDSYGRVLRATDPFGLYVDYTYNAKGLVSSVKNYKNQVCSYEYDAWERNIKTNNYDRTIEKRSYSWDNTAQGSLYKEIFTVTGKPASQTYFDAFSRVVREGSMRFDGSYLNVDRIYTDRGLLQKVSLPFKSSSAAFWNTYTYDSYDRIKRINYASGKIDSYLYGRNQKIATIDGITTTKVYDASNMLISSTDPGGAITYNYSAGGQLSSIIAPGNQTTSFEYDVFGRCIKLTSPGTGSKRWEYDANGYPSREYCTTPNAPRRTINYDKYGRLVKIFDSGGAIDYYYNADNQLAKEEDTRNGTVKEYQYDNYGRLREAKESTSNMAKWVKKSYVHSDGLLVRVFYETHSGLSASENYNFSAKNRTTIWLNDQIRIWNLYSENDLGQPTTIITGPVYRAYEYDSYGWPKARNTTGGSQYQYQKFSYVFDATKGNLSSRKDNNRNITEPFAYDSQNRLTGYGGKTASYDIKGNITGKSDVGDFSYGLANNPYAISEVNTLLSAISSQTQDVAYSLFSGRPTRITEGDYKVTISMGGDDNRCLMQVMNGTTTELLRTYVSDYYEIDEGIAGTKEKLYLGGDAYTAPAVYVKQGTGNWQLYYIFRDHLGSITHISNSNGALVQELSYDAWGRLRNPVTQEPYAPGSEPELFLGRGYTGHEHLPWVGLINMNARLYDPVLGRFLSADQYVQSPDLSQNFNRYAYCLNNPLKYTDPSGNIVEWIAAGLIYLGYNYYQGYIANNNQPNPFKWDWKNANYVAGFSTNGNGNSTVYGGVGWGSQAPISTVGYGTQSGFGCGIGANLYYPKSKYSEKEQELRMVIHDIMNEQQSLEEYVAANSYTFYPQGGGLDNVYPEFEILLTGRLLYNAVGDVIVSNAAGTQTVYRAVNAAEKASINNSKNFLLKEGGTEVKYFAKTLKDAHWYGNKLYPEGYSIIQGTVNSSVNAGMYWYPYVDIGAYAFPRTILPYVKPIIP